MIQVGMVVISEPIAHSDFDAARRELFIMECNVRRMRHMIHNGYFCAAYSEEEWQKFKTYKSKKK